MRGRFRTVLILSACFGLLACSGKSPPIEPSYRHVVLISLDTLRADHLGCYGNERVRTPSIDALAVQGVLFEDVTAAAPTTLASHTSIFSGTYPRTHGVVRNGFQVNPSNEMLPEILSAAGFETGAFVGSFALDSRFGFDQGFDRFDQSLNLETDGTRFDQDQRRAKKVTDAALEWVDQSTAEHLFLFVHYFDPHAAYAPPPPFNTLYTEQSRAASSDFGDITRAIQAQQDRIAPPGPGMIGAIRQGLSRRLLDAADGRPMEADGKLAALYAGEVSYTDWHVGRLLNGLRRAGVLDDAIVVLTADHGESFWEHADYWNHGLWVYQNTVRVPLIFRFPDRKGEGTRIDTPVSSIDILPTLLALLELPAPEIVEGVDLSPALQSLPLERGMVFSEATQPVGRFEQETAWGNALKAKAARQGSWKYVWAPYLDYEELFDLASDPGERRNLLIDPNPEALEVRDRLRAGLETWSKARQPLPSRFNPDRHGDVLERLRALGYVGGTDSDDRP